MEFIRNLEDIKENIKTLEAYLIGSEEEQVFAKNLIKKGKCFFPYQLQVNGMVKFIPSRFLGYKANTMNKHLYVGGLNGGSTNSKLKTILKSGLAPDSNLEDELIHYGAYLGIIPNKGLKRFFSNRPYLLL